MTRSDVRIIALAIEAFRGFRDRQVLDMDASTVILTGPNGTGKTSVFDALQWVLLGSLERLEGLRARRNVEHVVNLYRQGERASVELTLMVDDREVTVSRNGDYRESTLEVRGAAAKSLYGEAARDWLGGCLLPDEPSALGTALTTCGLLQQDVMRSVLEAKPADRYAHISTVLGLQGLQEFEEAARAAAKEGSDQDAAAAKELVRARDTVETASSLVETLEQRALQRVSVSVARAEVERLVLVAPASVTTEFPAELGVDLASDLAQGCQELADNVSMAARTMRDIQAERERLEPIVSEDEIAGMSSRLEAATAAVETAMIDREEAVSRLSSVEQASEDFSRLAAAALPLLAPDCPVCGQPIDPEEVATRLRAIASDSTTLVELRTEVEAASARIDELTAERIAHQSALDSALKTNQRWEELHSRQVALSEELRQGELLRSGPISIESPEPGSLAEIAADVIDWLTRLRSALERHAEVVRESQSAGDIDRAKAELESARAALEEKSAHADRVAKRAARLKQLGDAAATARVDVTSERFEAIEPLVSDIYSRLDPHPAFKMIGFEHDTYYGKGASSPVVRDLVAEVGADPLIVFSASQANIAALSYFLAMSLGAGDRALPFVLLDDPLQSMDDVNVLGFADLCRFIRSERQLMISAHDPRFANLLRRKLTPRTAQGRTIVYEFTGWDRRGPAVAMEMLHDELQDEPLRLVASSA